MNPAITIRSFNRRKFIEAGALMGVGTLLTRTDTVRAEPYIQFTSTSSAIEMENSGLVYETQELAELALYLWTEAHASDPIRWNGGNGSASAWSGSVFSGNGSSSSGSAMVWLEDCTYNGGPGPSGHYFWFSSSGTKTMYGWKATRVSTTG